MHIRNVNHTMYLRQPNKSKKSEKADWFKVV